MEDKTTDEPTEGHMQNFCCGDPLARLYEVECRIEIGARSAAFCHLANIAYRVGSHLKVDPKTGQFIGDAKANELWTRKYRGPYMIPENV